VAEELPTRNVGLDLVRVTETTALAAGRWIGSGNRAEAHRAATRAMAAALNTIDINGRIVIGEERGSPVDDLLQTGNIVGTGNGPDVDLVVDPIDGTDSLVRGRPGSISLVGVAPRGSMWSPVPAVYMEKIIVDRRAAKVLTPECMDAPAAWTLALIARAKEKAVRDMTVIVLDRPRHKHLIDEIRATGARILLRDEGDAEGSLVVTSPETGVDILMGIGGASQGVIAACAVHAMEGAMLARLAPQSKEELNAVRKAGLDPKRILTAREIVSSNEVFFAATGITHSRLLSAMQFHGTHATTHSLLMRAETGTRRFIIAEHAARIIK
jgi:fructose-1,6-bisphosphatase II